MIKRKVKKKEGDKKEGDKKEEKPKVPRKKIKKDHHIRPVKATLINELKLDNIKKICGGHQHSAILTDDGEVYIWGRNNFGQLGLGKKADEEVAEPTRLPAIKNIVDISCGAYHTVIVNREGDVYAFGLSRDGRIPSDNDTENVPFKICGELKKHKIIQVHCGKRHNLLVGEKS